MLQVLVYCLHAKIIYPLYKDTKYAYPPRMCIFRGSTVFAVALAWSSTFWTVNQKKWTGDTGVVATPVMLE